MNSKKPRVYLDTNAINILADKFCGKSKRSISNKYEILFSLPLLDEVINCSSQWRQAELASFMWDVSNRKVLCDIKNLIFLEVDSFLKKEQIDFENYFERWSVFDIQSLIGYIGSKTDEFIRKWSNKCINLKEECYS